MGEAWRYRLVVAAPDGSLDEESETSADEHGEWELVSTTPLDDGRTEQKLFRRPA